MQATVCHGACEGAIIVRFTMVGHAMLPQALYNIAKVAREDFITFFPEVFEALFKLCADSERNVQNAAQFLDNLIKARRPPLGYWPPPAKLR